MYQPAEHRDHSPSPPKSPRHELLPTPPSPCVVLASSLPHVQELQRQQLYSQHGIRDSQSGRLGEQQRQEPMADHVGPANKPADHMGDEPKDTSYTRNFNDDAANESIMAQSDVTNIAGVPQPKSTTAAAAQTSFSPPPPLSAPVINSDMNTSTSPKRLSTQTRLTQDEIEALAEKWIGIEERRVREWDSFQRVKRTGGGALGSYGSGAAGVSNYSSHQPAGGEGVSLDFLNNPEAHKPLPNEIVVPLPVPYNLQGETDYSYLYDDPNGANHNQVLAAIERAEEKARAEAIKVMIAVGRSSSSGGILGNPQGNYSAAAVAAAANFLQNGNDSTSSIVGASASASLPLGSGSATTPISLIGMAGNSGPNSGAYGYASTGRHETRAFMDIAIGSALTERITFELYDTECPLAVENFCKLITGLGGFDARTGIKLDYSCSNVYCVKKNEEIQMGFLCLNSLAAAGGDGSDGADEKECSPTQNSYQSEAVYVAEERLNLRHLERGLLSMKSFGPNHIGSFFSVTLAPAPSLDFKQVIIGHVVEGRSVLDKIEAVALSSRTCAPIVPITIAFSGVLSGNVKPGGIEAAKRFYQSEVGRSALQRFAEASATEATLIKKNTSPALSPQRRVTPSRVEGLPETTGDAKIANGSRNGSARRHRRSRSPRQRKEPDMVDPINTDRSPVRRSDNGSCVSDTTINTTVAAATFEGTNIAIPGSPSKGSPSSPMATNHAVKSSYFQNLQRGPSIPIVPASQLFAVPMSPFFGNKFTGSGAVGNVSNISERLSTGTVADGSDVTALNMATAAPFDGES